MAKNECPCVAAEREVCSAGDKCRHFSTRGICTACGLGAPTPGRRGRRGNQTMSRVTALLGVINHMRICQVCAETDVLKCHLGRKVWMAAGLPVSENDERTT